MCARENHSKECMMCRARLGRLSHSRSHSAHCLILSMMY